MVHILTCAVQMVVVSSMASATSVAHVVRLGVADGRRDLLPPEHLSQAMSLFHIPSEHIHLIDYTPEVAMWTGLGYLTP